nr:stalk domain-containing protein [Peptoniphilus duerdenii]
MESATNKIVVNGNVYLSDVKPEIKNNRTMLPIANIARAIGLQDGKDIIWNSHAKTATIKMTK